MSADHLNHQVGGEHYRLLGDYQPWQVARAWLTDEQMVGGLAMMAIKYMGRLNCTAPGKGGLQDVRKAIHTLQYLEGVMMRNAAQAGERALHQDDD